MDATSTLVVFQGKNIRRIWHTEEWYFSVIDMVDALEASTIPKRYWADLKAKLIEEGFEPYDKIVQLKLLAKVGYERVQEIENPELAQKRMKEIYKSKGYSDDWIEKRVRGIAVRDELTDEWKKRGVCADNEYAILTSEISKLVVFDVDGHLSQHSQIFVARIINKLNKTILNEEEGLHRIFACEKVSTGHHDCSNCNSSGSFCDVWRERFL